MGKRHWFIIRCLKNVTIKHQEKANVEPECIKQHICSRNQKVNFGKIEWFKKRLFLPKETKMLVSFHQVKHSLKKEYDFFLQQASWGRIVFSVRLGKEQKYTFLTKFCEFRVRFFVVGGGVGGCDWFLSSLFWFGFFNPLIFLCQFGNTYRKGTVKCRFWD